MKKTRAALLALLRGFTPPLPADATDLKSVQKFIADNGLELKDDAGADIDVAKVWATTKALTLADDSDPGDEHEEPAAGADKKSLVLTGSALAEYQKTTREAAQKGRGTGAPRHPTDEPGSFSIGNWERRSYDMKAARGETKCESADIAEICGAWTRLALCSMKGLANPHKKNDEAICQKANVSYDFASGGWTIPEIMANQVLLLRPRYRALPSLLPFTPVPPQGESFPRSATDNTVYSTSEGVALTESNPGGDQYKLTPFSMDVLTTVTNKLLASSAITFGEFVIGRMQYSKDKKLEEIYFNGDGTSTYFNQIGIIGAFSKLVTDAGGTWTTNANYAAGINVASGSAWSQITYPDLMTTFGKPAYLESDGPVQFACSRPFFWQVVMPLMDGRGGATREEIMNGVARPMFQGVPGVYTNALSQSSVTATIPLIVGDFATASAVGVVPELTTISQSDQRYWEQRKIGFMLSAYHAVNVHDIGNASATAASRVTGPLTALIMA